MTQKILSPQGTEKPPKGVKCWWTAADYEKAYIKENYVAEISKLKAKLKIQGIISDRKSFLADIKPIKKFGGHFISGYEVEYNPRLDLKYKDKLVWIPIKTRSIYKNDLWWIARLIELVEELNKKWELAETRRKNKLNRRIYDERLNSKLVVIP